MAHAFYEATNALAGHGKSLVLAVNVTDGEPDHDPAEWVKGLAQGVTRQGGQLLMTNIHITHNADPDKALVFPTPDQAAHLDAYGKMLFAMSSEVPAELAAKLGTAPGARMFAYNAAPSQLAAVLRAGSSVAGTAGGGR